MPRATVRNFTGLCGFACVLCVVGGCPPIAAAQQVVILDQTYEANAGNTEDSHYRVDPDANAPDNWRAPVDYANGRAHARLEVLSKPSDVPTLYNICFEGTPSYACMPYSPAYTAPGVYDFEYDFSGFYQYDMVDWSQATERIALILKDENEQKKQGDPNFYPTQIHITITLVAPGATYEPPSENPDPPDAGDPDPGIDGSVSTADAGEAQAGSSAARAGSAAEPPPKTTPMAGSGGKPSAGGTGGTGQAPTTINAGAGGSSAAGSSATPMPMAGNTGAAPRPTAEQTKDDTAGLCAASPRNTTPVRGAWLGLALAWFLIRRTRTSNRRMPRLRRACGLLR